jgi:hypothetical protein
MANARTPNEFFEAGLCNDILAGFQGDRTGFATPYFKHTLRWTRYVTEGVGIRPELRFEDTTGTKAYDSDARRDKIAVAMDMISRCPAETGQPDSEYPGR